MPPPQLILASVSESRRRLLTEAGLTFDVVPPGVDEEEVKRSLAAERAPPLAVAETLADLKATGVSARHPAALVVGGDSTLACNGRMFDKPVSLDAARQQLIALRGQTHDLISAVVVARAGTRIWHHTERGRLTMRPFDEAFLDTYLERAGKSVTTSVGAYRLESIGAHLFSRVDGDYFTILGLPLLPLLSFLQGHGIGLEAKP